MKENLRQEERDQRHKKGKAAWTIINTLVELARSAVLILAALQYTDLLHRKTLLWFDYIIIIILVLLGIGGFVMLGRKYFLWRKSR